MLAMTTSLIYSTIFVENTYDSWKPKKHQHKVSALVIYVSYKKWYKRFVPN